MVDSLINYVGVFLVNLLWYLVMDYMKYCVFSNVFSGFFNCLLCYVYYNGVFNVFEFMIMKFLSGELIDGKVGYERIMCFFIIINYMVGELI